MKDKRLQTEADCSSQAYNHNASPGFVVAEYPFPAKAKIGYGKKFSQSQLVACFDTFANTPASVKTCSSFKRFDGFIGVSGRR